MFNLHQPSISKEMVAALAGMEPSSLFTYSAAFG
jgi:hypothetical protein